MARFRVGDIVRIKSKNQIKEYPKVGDGHYQVGCDVFIPTMFKYCKRLAKVVRVLTPFWST